MAFKSVTITASGDPEWQGRQGPDPFKPRSHYCMLILLVLGMILMIAIGIWIGVDVIKRENAPDPVYTTKPAGSGSSTTTTTVSTTTTEATTTTTTIPVSTSRSPRSTVASG